MVKHSRTLASAAVAAFLSAAVATPVWAESLKDAIAMAYQTNPTLLAQRANQRALDETVVQARAGLRPTLSIGASANYQHNDIFGVTSESDTGGVSVDLSQTLYSGGRIGHGISAAEASVMAGRENLREVEQQVIAQVIQAYADVVRDTEILRIRRDNLGVLQRQQEEASARFEVGEITRTDVAQAEARLAQSEAELATAQAQLSTSRAAYAAVVGQAPGTLEDMPVLPGVPTDFDLALDTALEENPGIRAALYNLAAAEYGVAEARSAYMPSARLSGSYGGSTLDLGSPSQIGDRRSFQTGVSVSVPLFTGGMNASRVAQARERANAAQIGVEGERRQVLQAISSSYAQAISARSTLEAGREAVRAASVAAEGVRQEAQVGLRTTLDVLNQELELRSAQVSLAAARRNEYVAQANLLSAMGRLQGRNMDAQLDTYDADANYQAVRNRGALPWDGLIETLDRLAAPPVVPAADQPDAPIDAQMKIETGSTPSPN